MQSGVKNRFGEQVEQLDAFGTIIIIDENSAFVNNSVLIPLVNSRVYEIRRIKSHLSYFNNPDLRPSDYAFAQWEQFSSAVMIDAAITDGLGTVQKDLFINLPVYFEGGCTFNKIFEEPFVFDLTNSSAVNLKITFKPQNFIFMAISLMTIPPAAGQQVLVNGFCSLEGVSYPLLVAEANRQLNIDKSIVTETDQPNLIDIDPKF